MTYDSILDRTEMPDLRCKEAWGTNVGVILGWRGLVYGPRPDKGIGRPDLGLRSWKLLIVDLRGLRDPILDLRGLN